MSKIIIPSKNIYSKNNDILKKNSIGKVLFNYNQARAESQEHIEVANLTATEYYEDHSLDNDFNFAGRTYTYNSKPYFRGVLSGVRIENFYRTKAEKVYTIPFDNFDENVYVDGIDEILTKNIYVLGKLQKYSAKATMQVSLGGTVTYNGQITDIKLISEKEETYAIPTYIESSASDTFYGGDAFSSRSEVKIESKMPQNIDTDLDSNNLKFWVISGLEAPIGIEYWTLSYSTNETESEYQYGELYSFPITKYVYIPTEAYIKVNGSTFAVKLTNKEIQKTSPKSTNPFSIESNELMQDKTAYDSFAQRVLDVYENGKETATIRCGINDYYATKSINNFPVQWGKFEYDSIKRSYFYSFPENYYVLRSNSKVKAIVGSDPLWGDEQTVYYEAYAQNNKIYVKPLTEHIGYINNIYLSYDYIELDKDLEKVVDTSNQDSMCFKMHDVVLPLARNGAGEEEFLSYDKNGNPKAFEIIGINMIYDGAVYQELTLQEYIE